MALKLIMFVGLIGIAFTGVYNQMSQFVTHQVLAKTYKIDPAARQNILDATVQITLFAPVLDEIGQPELTEVNGEHKMQYLIGEGLGTLVNKDGNLVIVTHDHWTLVEHMTIATFANVQGEVLLTVTAVQFQQMIQYQDGGTMILALEERLLGTAVSSSTNQTIERNNVLLLAYRQPTTGQVDVVPVMIDEMKLFQERPSYYLRSLHNEVVVGGNSGGGLFVDGELVGNMWIALVVQEVRRDTGIAVGPEQQTNLSIAAQLQF
jgi:hypothetical protein